MCSSSNCKRPDLAHASPRTFEEGADILRRNAGNSAGQQLNVLTHTTGFGDGHYDGFVRTVQVSTTAEITRSANAPAGWT